MNGEINGVVHTDPLWSHCLECEFQLGTPALKHCREARYPLCHVVLGLKKKGGVEMTRRPTFRVGHHKYDENSDVAESC